jgi:chaperonin GroEL
VSIGAPTETEIKEKQHRVAGAPTCARAGPRFRWRHRAAAAANAVHLDGFEKHDEKTGATIALRALKEPLRQIDHNAGLEGSVIVNDVRKPSGSADSPREHHIGVLGAIHGRDQLAPFGCRRR